MKNILAEEWLVAEQLLGGEETHDDQRDRRKNATVLLSIATYSTGKHAISPAWVCREERWTSCSK